MKSKKIDLSERFAYHLNHTLAENTELSTILQKFFALSYSVRDLVVDKWLKTEEIMYKRKDLKIVNYLSMEFLIGRLLYNNILNLQAEKEVREVLEKFNLDLSDIALLEEDAALG
ncbi:MAG: glycogen phosphorylase, partial [Fervidobacterium sp.]